MGKNRYSKYGEEGFVNASSKPKNPAGQTQLEVEAKVVETKKEKLYEEKLAEAEMEWQRFCRAHPNEPMADRLYELLYNNVQYR